MFASLKIKCLGARLVGGQIDRIEEGFREEGCQVVSRYDEADFTFVNDQPHYAEAIAAKARGELKGKLILGILDLAPHVPSFPLAHVKEQLSHADAITTISQTVQRDIRARLGVEATVVYNPIRRIERDRHPDAQFYKAIFVGRVNDPEKRAGMGAAALTILGYQWDDMVTVGREPPHYGGVYAGELDDATLEGYYNASTFLMCPTRNAFLGLPILEAMACGTIPVVCNDLDVRAEFLPPSVFPEYDSVTADAPSIARFVAHYMQDNDAKAEMSERVYRHYQQHWAEKLSPVGAAQSILNVYSIL